MPWQEVCYMDERMRFIGAVLREEDSMAALCEQYGVSRKTGYKWLSRYLEQGPAGLGDRSHAPLVVPWAITLAQREAILCLRGEHPSWGPKKLQAVLSERAPQQRWPALSTIGDLLQRQGLTRAGRRHARATPSASGLRAPIGPNDLWCIDFKGWFRTHDGARCDPLTVSDAFSRYVLCAQGVSPPAEAPCHSAMERVFKEYGLPGSIRSDNGAPFASTGAGGLSRLSVWWVKLGITPERIKPGKPQQNGRHERMHRTLKAECASPPAADQAAQQRRFDHFRHEFNYERPHEALGQTVPAAHYVPSSRPYPSRLEDPAYPADFDLRRVRSNGEIKWQGELVFTGAALTGEVVGLLENDDGNCQVYFGPVLLGLIDAVSFKLTRGTP